MTLARDPAPNFSGTTDAANLSLPLSWWRVLAPEALDMAAQRRLSAALNAAQPLPSPHWSAACRGDPAAATHIALSILAEAVASPGRLDPAMSAICLCAARGDGSCIDLLVHVLGRRARRRADLEVLCLAHAWCSVPRRGAGRVCVAR
ncbi:hypothetical protein ACU4GR_27570 [Methylobacterium oryzae CBMB20]